MTATVAGSEKVELETNLTLSQPEKTQYDKEVYVHSWVELYIPW